MDNLTGNVDIQTVLTPFIGKEILLELDDSEKSKFKSTVFTAREIDSGAITPIADQIHFKESNNDIIKGDKIGILWNAILQTAKVMSVGVLGSICDGAASYVRATKYFDDDIIVIRDMSCLARNELTKMDDSSIRTHPLTLTQQQKQIVRSITSSFGSGMTNMNFTDIITILTEFTAGKQNDTSPAHNFFLGVLLIIDGIFHNKSLTHSEIQKLEDFGKFLEQNLKLFSNSVELMAQSISKTITICRSVKKTFTYRYFSVFGVETTISETEDRSAFITLDNIQRINENIITGISEEMRVLLNIESKKRFKEAKEYLKQFGFNQVYFMNFFYHHS